MMRRHLMLFIAFLFVFVSVGNTQITNSPLAKYENISISAIAPGGWLHNQLLLMRKGTTGHLDEVYEKIRDANGWLGGNGDGWEETPYWLDGAVPLAYLLNDNALKEKLLRYINWTLNNQRPSGYFGPITKAEKEGRQITANNCEDGQDWWPKMIMLKVLQQYYLATTDQRVLAFMEKYFNYQLQVLSRCPIKRWTEWAESRGADNAMMAIWLYKINGNKKLLELASLIQKQSYPWTYWLGNRDWVIHAATYQDEVDWLSRHAVNVAMGLKAPVIDYQLTANSKKLDSLKTGFRDLMTLHGLPMGIFSGDEDLHGNAPSQGVELCAIVEAMFSLEQISKVTGDVHYIDALERMTFNALPTQTTDDYNAKQYYQIANQVQVTNDVFDFSLPWSRRMCNVYGMRSGYTCCLANMHQGWTKFAAQLWLKTGDGGLAALTYSPNVLTTTVGKQKQPVTIREETSYPFSDEIRFVFQTTKATSFPFHLRIPAWCKEASITLNGKEVQKAEGGKIIILQQLWKNGDELLLKMPMEIKITKWGLNSRAVERGPLVYALKLQERWEKKNDEKEGDYYTILPETDWNYGLLEKAVKDPAIYFTIKEQKVADNNFIWNIHHAPIEIATTGKKIPSWKITDGVARQPVTERMGFYKGDVVDKEEEIKLVPYGCTKVRVVAFPIVR